MKKIFFSLIAVSLFTASCNDLDVLDKASLSKDVALEDISGYQTLLNAAYESVNDFAYYGQSMMIGPEILADNMELAQLTGRYELEYVNAENSGINIWANRYSAINECNIIINTINDESVTGGQAAKDVLRGEALFLRALFYHDLARVYGYEPGQEVDNFNSSVVLKTTATLGLSDVVDLPRATNEAVYGQIESDLLAAISLLPTVAAGSSDVIFANADAAKLLLARVYLYWGKSAQAADYAQQVIVGDGSDLVASGDYLDSWDDAAFPIYPESLFESEIRVPNDWNTVDGPNNSLHSLLMNNSGGSQFIIVASDELIAEIENDPDDVRINMFNTEDLGLEFNKWRGLGPTPHQENIPILRLSEAYLIAAEALGAGAGAGDALLNAFRAQRGMTNAVSASVDNVLRERRIEFMAEGHRWFDLKRLGRDITKPADAGSGTLPYTNYKVLPRIPQSEINLSEDILVQNPGYN